MTTTHRQHPNVTRHYSLSKSSRFGVWKTRVSWVQLSVLCLLNIHVSRSFVSVQPQTSRQSSSPSPIIVSFYRSSSSNYFSGRFGGSSSALSGTDDRSTISGGPEPQPENEPEPVPEPEPEPESKPELPASRLVWLTGHADLRVTDHGGFTAASSTPSQTTAVPEVTPVFVFDPSVHLHQPRIRLSRLLVALRSVERELEERYGIPLVVQIGDASKIIPDVASSIGASSCHLVEDDVEGSVRSMQRTTVEALVGALGGDVQVERWNTGLRNDAGWTQDPASMPDTWKEYAQATTSFDLTMPLDAPQTGRIVASRHTVTSECIPTDVDSLINSLESVNNDTYRVDKPDMENTDPPYQQTALALCDAENLREAIQTYVTRGRDHFANTYLSDALSSPSNTTAQSSLHAVAAQRLLDGAPYPDHVLSLREAPVRAFSPGLALGVVSYRQLRTAVSSEKKVRPDKVTVWGRGSEDALVDTVEWSEFYRNLAKRTLALGEDGGTDWMAGGRRGTEGDKRDRTGEVGFWKWGGQHVVRYVKWAGDDDETSDDPALLLVHGFAASVEQWERFVYALKAQAETDPNSKLPTIYAIDLLGFGHSEKPGFSYTQYLWEAQVVDFVREIVQKPVALMGNSIGGGLSASAASTLGHSCRGVVLCNTAGELVPPSDYVDPPTAADTVGEQTRSGNFPYSPLPLGKRSSVFLELFGYIILGTVGPSIRKRLSDIYTKRPENADDSLAFAIEQSAAFPGSPNVIGCGQKLAPNRPLNEVLGERYGFGGPVLVTQGLNDNFSGERRAVERADALEILRDGVKVVRIPNGGHCPQDDSPEEVAAAVWEWLPEVRGYCASV